MTLMANFFLTHSPHDCIILMVTLLAFYIYKAHLHDKVRLCYVCIWLQCLRPKAKETLIEYQCSVECPKTEIYFNMPDQPRGQQLAAEHPKLEEILYCKRPIYTELAKAHPAHVKQYITFILRAYALMQEARSIQRLEEYAGFGGKGTPTALNEIDLSKKLFFEHWNAPYKQA